MGRNKPTKRLSSNPHSSTGSAKVDTRFDFQNSGPSVQEKAARLTGRSINRAPEPALSLAQPIGNRPIIESNVRQLENVTRCVNRSETSVSGLTSSADQYNSYRFDEASALKTYKKMMMLHLKDEMFSKVKFITCDHEMEFSRNTPTLCAYV